MAGDVQLTALAIESAPLTYTVPLSAEVLLKSVRAEFDGSGAAGSWLPAVQIVSDSAHIVATASDQGAVVSAGGSADGSFFPGVKPSTTGGGGSSTAPFVATFYRSVSEQGDAPQTIGAGATENLTWAHAALPSTGEITGPIIGDVFVQFTVACITDEWLRVQWADGTFARAQVFGTNSHIFTSDSYAFTNDGAVGVGADGTSVVWGTDQRPNAHTVDELLHCYVTNASASAQDVNEAWLCIRGWAASGYNGAIPGWPQ